jgi:hypothetical protein
MIADQHTLVEFLLSFLTEFGSFVEHGTLLLCAAAFGIVANVDALLVLFAAADGAAKVVLLDHRVVDPLAGTIVLVLKCAGTITANDPARH